MTLNYLQTLEGAMWLIKIAYTLDLTHRQKNTLLAIAFTMLETHRNNVFPAAVPANIPF